ncbi:Xaa-Pro aminopeptidase [Ranunculus cassubicifolius]
MQSLRRILLQKFSFNQNLGRCTYSTIIDVGQPTSASHPQLLKEEEMTPGITIDEYKLRRKNLLELLPKNSLAIFAAAPVKMMTDVVPYNFRQDADYSYITGCQQPGGVAVLGHDCGLCMFMPEQDVHDVTWQGRIAGVDAALETFKADNAYPLTKMHKVLPDMIKSSSKLFHNVKTALPSYTGLEVFRNASNSGNVGDLSIYTHELRWIKSQAEVKLMREAASIACQALLQTVLFSKTSPDESKLSAKFDFECKMRGAQRMAFNPVVGGGANGSVIHYSRNDQKIKDGDLVLMDVGCELHGYVSDLTRTWPPCGSFSPPQEELYSLILETNKKCITFCKPGTSIRQIHNHSVAMLCKGLKEIGISKDEKSIARIYNQLNPTSIGHYLGMDVHDSATISVDKPLKPGVVITIEPGIYIPSSSDVPEWFKGTGIRIEDEVLITENGYEVLTGSMPKEVEHLKSLLNNHSH